MIFSTFHLSFATNHFELFACRSITEFALCSWFCVQCEQKTGGKDSLYPDRVHILRTIYNPMHCMRQGEEGKGGKKGKV